MPRFETGEVLPMIGTGEEVPMIGTEEEVPMIGTGEEVPMIGTGKEVPRFRLFRQEKGATVCGISMCYVILCITCPYLCYTV